MLRYNEPSPRIGRELLDHELYLMGRHYLDALLEHVIAMWRLKELDHMASQKVKKQKPLATARNFQCFLQHSATM